MVYNFSVCPECQWTPQEIAKEYPAGGTINASSIIRCYQGDKTPDMLVTPHKPDCTLNPQQSIYRGEN